MRSTTQNALPPVVDAETWHRELEELRVREKAATRELDAIAAQRRRLPMVEMPDYTLMGEYGPVRLVDVFEGKSQLIVFSTAGSAFGADVDAPAGGGFAVNVFLRDGDTVYRTWHTNGRGTEQLSHTFPLIDVLPYGRREEWQDSPEGWPKTDTFDGWFTSQKVAELYGPGAHAHA